MYCPITAVLNYTMLYVSSVLKCVLIIYLLRERQVCARHKSSYTKYKIDEFIDKLLASKKFDTLAEKIAQKAVERMMDLKPNLRVSKDFAAQNIASDKIDLKNVSYNTDVHFEDAQSPVKNLSLKFKYFTKGPTSDILSVETKDTGGKEFKESNAKNSTDREIKKTDDDEESINLSDLEIGLEEKVENTSENLKHEDERLTNQNKTKEQEVENEGSLSAENKKNADLFSETELVESHKTKETHANESASEFEKKVIKDKALFSNESKAPIINRELQHSRKRVHREGNKLYTFQTSSEYEEYHQELQRVEKKRNVFV